ncbi:hypothetical protein QBC46DRAFT_275266 [Diplogelasinospora grovesii]|uniref:Protein kinase domain-containing protein n=1 Tax=Diplogelasinospora grovesii TaxID=303347 RepID=A0AAN6MUJ4_9PEZI|nr:hypothetical protein QBC46DRAFT_275266 [Diplogelasinospora grovesii]
MFLRRKPAFLRESIVVPTKVLPAVYLNRSPGIDYKPVNIQKGTWIGVHRNRGAHQFVVVQELRHIDITDFSFLAQSTHTNITQPLGLYYCQDGVYITYEYVELDLLDILPLSSETEVASVMSQILSGIVYLINRSIDFRVQSIHVSLYGVVKLVLDWNHKPATDPSLVQITNRLMSAYLDEIMSTMRGKPWSNDAVGFLSILKSGYLPHASHPFLAQSKGRIALKNPVNFAVRSNLGKRISKDTNNSGRSRTL